MKESITNVVKHHFSKDEIIKAVIWVRAIEAHPSIEHILRACQFSQFRFIEHLNSSFVVENIECIVGHIPKELHVTIKYIALSEEATTSSYTERITVGMGW